MTHIVEHSSTLRIAFFFIGLLVFGLGGVFFAYRAFDWKRDSYRWLNNLSLTLVNAFTVYFLVPFSLVSLASHYSQTQSDPWKVGLQVVFLDMVIYWQHFLFHKVNFLWQLHRVHHTDTEFDSTTALRFHTAEIYISFFVKAFAIWAVGIDPVAVVIFEIILNFSAMFNHGNFSLPKTLERINLLVVTPDMHRIHHSIDVKERDSNYGFFLSIWDRVFGTYSAGSKHDLKQGKIGSLIFRSRSEQALVRLLIQPFIRPPYENTKESAGEEFKKSS